MPPQPGTFEYASDPHLLENFHPTTSGRRKARNGGPAPRNDMDNFDHRVKVIRGTGGVANGSTSSTGRGYGAVLSTSSPAGHGTIEPDIARNRDTITGLKRKREMQDRIRKYAGEVYDHRDDMYSALINALVEPIKVLQTAPSESRQYTLSLYPISLERGALLNAIVHEEQHALSSTKSLFNAEIRQIEEEFERGRTRLRERVMEGLEERRRRAREEKESEGVVPVESSLEVTASTLNRVSANTPSFPPPFHLAAPIPYGLSPDDLTSPYPLSLTSITPAQNTSTAGTKGPGRKPRTGVGRGAAAEVAAGTSLVLGRSILQITGSKEYDIDSDLGEIRRALKRKRAAARAAGVTAV